MWTDFLLGVGGGSVLTTLAGRILGMIQKQKEHKYSLQRFFFEKKLQAAELAVSQCYTFASSLGCLVALYERMSKEEKELEIEVFREMNQGLWAQLDRISQASMQMGNSMLLYFDVDESEFWNYDGLLKFLDSLSSLHAMSGTIRAAVEYYDESKHTEHEEQARRQLRSALERCKPHFKDISSALRQAWKDMIDLMRKLRSEMKTYEP